MEWLIFGILRYLFEGANVALKFLKLYPASRGLSIFLDLTTLRAEALRSSYLSSRKAKKISGYRCICLRHSEFFYSLSYDCGWICFSHFIIKTISIYRQGVPYNFCINYGCSISWNFPPDPSG